jgi:phosphoribosyl 1,2-cyclic phosphodiesterase
MDRPPFSFHALASGSSGNAFLLRTPRAAVLLEAGLRLPLLRRYLGEAGLTPEDLTAVFVSHEHRDHCLSARDLALDCGAPVYSNSHVLRAIGLQGTPKSRVVEPGDAALIGDVEIGTFRVQHDAVCPVGFLVHVAGRTISLATDLGEVTDGVQEAVNRADLVILEANHDYAMLHNGRYPYHLRRRVSSSTGHLSNSQAAQILAESVRPDAAEVWLAHLSKENNTPTLALQTVRQQLKSARRVSVTVDVLRRDRPSLRWTGMVRPRQLSLLPEGI